MAGPGWRVGARFAPGAPGVVVFSVAVEGAGPPGCPPLTVEVPAALSVEDWDALLRPGHTHRLSANGVTVRSSGGALSFLVDRDGGVALVSVPADACRRAFEALAARAGPGARAPGPI